MFYKNDRIHYDKNEYVQSDILNEKQINYNLYNNKNSESNVKYIALKQPNVFYSDLNPITKIVDDNSNLLLNKKVVRDLKNEKLAMKKKTAISEEITDRVIKQLN